MRIYIYSSIEGKRNVSKSEKEKFEREVFPSRTYFFMRRLQDVSTSHDFLPQEAPEVHAHYKKIPLE